MDDSVSSQHAFEWMERTLLRDGDEVHMVVVALPVPYPVSLSSPFPCLRCKAYSGSCRSLACLLFQVFNSHSAAAGRGSLYNGQLGVGG